MKGLKKANCGVGLGGWRGWGYGGGGGEKKEGKRPGEKKDMSFYYFPLLLRRACEVKDEKGTKRDEECKKEMKKEKAGEKKEKHFCFVLFLNCKPF